MGKPHCNSSICNFCSMNCMCLFRVSASVFSVLIRGKCLCFFCLPWLDSSQKKQIILFVLVITSIPSLKTIRVGLGELGQTGGNLGPRLLTPSFYALVLKLSQKVL